MKIKIRYTNKFLSYLKKLDIDKEFLDNFIRDKCLLYRKKYNRPISIIISTHGNRFNSQYQEIVNLIEVAYFKFKSKRYSRLCFFRDFLHEFRHFIQYTFFKIDFDNQYSQRDLDTMNENYFNSFIEKDAYKYEKNAPKIYKKFIKYKKRLQA